VPSPDDAVSRGAAAECSHGRKPVESVAFRARGPEGRQSRLEIYRACGAHAVTVEDPGLPPGATVWPPLRGSRKNLPCDGQLKWRKTTDCCLDGSFNIG